MILWQGQLCLDILKLDDVAKFFNLLLKCNLLAEIILHMIIVGHFLIFNLNVVQVGD